MNTRAAELGREADPCAGSGQCFHLLAKTVRKQSYRYTLTTTKYLGSVHRSVTLGPEKPQMVLRGALGKEVFLVRGQQSVVPTLVNRFHAAPT